MTIKILPPLIVRNEPKYVQVAYIREFTRVKEQTDDVLAAKSAADRLLAGIKHLAYKQYHKTKQFQRALTVSISASISEMSAEKCIPIEILSKIRETDPHPYFVVYDAGGEGVSDGKVDNRKERKVWSFGAIKQLAKNLMGAGIIIGHSGINEHNKTKMGKIIHSFTQKIRNSLHAIGVAHIVDKQTIEKIEKGELDVCSIEGDVVLARDKESDANWFIRTVDCINNLALGNSTVHNPGFNSAGVLATIQEMNRETK